MNKCKDPTGAAQSSLPSLLELWSYFLLLPPSFIPLVFLLFLQHCKQAPDFRLGKQFPQISIQISFFKSLFKCQLFSGSHSNLPIKNCYLLLQPLTYSSFHITILSVLFIDLHSKLIHLPLVYKFH